jgi:murein L,D-transpeptidase YcbB/YkuD
MRARLELFQNLLTVSCHILARQFSVLICCLFATILVSADELIEKESTSVLVRQQELLRSWLVNNSVIHFDLDRHQEVIKRYSIIIETKDLIKLYQARNFSPIWTDQEFQPTKIGAIAREYMQVSSPRHGLNPEDYFSFELKSISAIPGNAQNWMYYEIMMADAFLRLGRDLAIGRLNFSQVEREFKFKRALFGSFEYLQSAMNSDSQGDFSIRMDKLAPQSELYKSFLMTLEKLRALEISPDWVTDIKLDADLKYGSRHSQIPLIRQRMNDLGYSVGLGSPVFDENFLAAVTDYQNLNGLKVDSIISRKGGFLRALNKKIKNRIEQIEINMERLRFLPRKMEANYVFINTAFSEFSLIENKNSVMKFNVIVGKQTRRTPSKRDILEEVVINPTWTIPPLILKKDKLAKVQSDSDYLANRNIRVFDHNKIEYNPLDIDWSLIDPENSPYELVQQPGLKNSLGVVKFPLYKHDDNIYLHDTSEKLLFEPEFYNRHRSSGCVRLEKPLELAAHLLKSSLEGTWNLETLKALVPPAHNEKDLVTYQLRINKPLPVYLVYLTVGFGDKGQLRFYDDIYGQDSRFLKLLNSNAATPIEPAWSAETSVPTITNPPATTSTVSSLATPIASTESATPTAPSKSTTPIAPIASTTLVNPAATVVTSATKMTTNATATLKLGSLLVSGEAGPTQLFSYVKAIPCKVVKTKVQRASCQPEKALAVALNVESKLPFGSYILGFENSIYPGFVKISQKLQKLKLEKIQMAEFENRRNSAAYRVIRDFSEPLEKNKNVFQTYYAQQPIFALAQYSFGGLYLKGSLQKDVSSRLSYRACESAVKIRSLSEEARTLCESAKVNSLTPSKEFFAVNKVNKKADGTFTEKWVSDDVMDVVVVKHPYHLVAAPLKFGEFVAVFPGSYRLIDEEGKVIQKFDSEAKDVPVDFKVLFKDSEFKNNDDSDRSQDLNI